MLILDENEEGEDGGPLGEEAIELKRKM